MFRLHRAATIALCATFSAASAAAQQAPAPITLTLKHSLELALQNSRDIKLARIQASVADRAAMIGKADFLPNLYVGSGAGYTYGIPETPGGRAPSVFNVTYTEQVFNLPLRGAAKEQQEQAKAQKILLEDARNTVIAGTATGYLELVKVRHSLELLKRENDSAERILGVTQERANEGFELPREVTRSQLTKAQVTQKILQLEGREDELETYLRSQLGLAAEQQFDLSADDLPGSAEQEGANLVAMAMENNTDIRLAQSDVRAKEFRYRGEKGGYLPTLELVSVYSLLAKFNNYAEFFQTFQRNNFNAGVQVQMPIFSARTKAAVGLADMNLQVAKASLENKKNQVSADVRRKTRRLREMDAAKEVARLQLQLAQQNVGALQSQFEEGKTNLRDVERARLDESDRWMAYLDATFQRQQAQVELLRTAGQLDKVLE
ncbi:MAG TPA: TolC family protein [Candidatus Sulfotelmatobacter sp.]|jgi:outer membrane protein TolC|nr:TolC family protein [Candidatus Sulfotelmatobacter sp.]